MTTGWMRVALLGGLVACGKGSSKQEPAPAAKGIDAGAVAVVIADAAPAPPDAKANLTGLPPLTMTAPTPEDAKRAVALHNQALPLHRAGKKDPKPLAEAIALYEQAVTANPAYLIARYNLASALSTGGQAERALAILAELRDYAAVSPCEKCLERLARARNDAEWKPLWDDPRFVEITKASSGPPAKVLIFSQVGACDTDEEPEGLSMEITLEPPPGFARMPALEVVVARKGKALGSWKPSDADADQCVRFPDIDGLVDVTLTVDGKKFATLKADPDRVGGDDLDFEQGTVRRPAVARCDALECPGFPAVSPDGAYLVFRDNEELMTPGDHCSPPIGDRTHYFRVTKDGLDEVGSQDLTGYEELACAPDDKLLDGYRVDVGDDFVKLVDPKGKVVDKADDLGDMPSVCASTKHRFVLVTSYYGVGGDCDEIGDYNHEMLAY